MQDDRHLSHQPGSLRNGEATIQALDLLNASLTGLAFIAN